MSLIPIHGPADSTPHSHCECECEASLENGSHVACIPIHLALLAKKCLATVLGLQVANWKIILQKSVGVSETWL